MGRYNIKDNIKYFVIQKIVLCIIKNFSENIKVDYIHLLKNNLSMQNNYAIFIYVYFSYLI